MHISRRVRVAMGAALLAGMSYEAARAGVVYDNVTNAENNTGSTDDGNDFTVLGSIYGGTRGTTKEYDNAGGGLFALTPGTTDITGFDLLPTVFVTNSSGGLLSGTAYNYSGLKITTYVWGNVNLGTANASNMAYSNLLGSYTFTDFEGTGAFSNGEIFNYEDPADDQLAPGISLPTPILIPGTVQTDSAGEPVVGISYVVTATQGTNGSTATYAAVDGVGATYSYGSPATVGDMANPGAATFNTLFYYNASNEQTGNFKEGPYSFTGINDSSLALRVYGDVSAVPEPASGVFVMAAAAGLLRRRISPRKN